MPNIASAIFTLSMRTVGFPCSNSRTKRSPRPERTANSSCVSPAALRLSRTNWAILFTINTSKGLNHHSILYPIGAKVNKEGKIIPDRNYMNSRRIEKKDKPCLKTRMHTLQKRAKIIPSKDAEKLPRMARGAFFVPFDRKNVRARSAQKRKETYE